MSRKHWREFRVNNLLPAKYQIVKSYTPLIESLVSIVINGVMTPGDMYKRFYSTFNKHIKPSISYTGLNPLLIQYLNDLDREDLVQQSFLLLLEMWEWYIKRWKPSSPNLFYDTVRQKLPRYLAIYLANQIKIYTAGLVPVPIEGCEDVPPRKPELSLGWVLLGKTDGILKGLSVKQKYLLFLRYGKKLTIKEISKLTSQCRSEVEREFSIINQIVQAQDPSSLLGQS